MSAPLLYRASCLCGDVAFTLTGAPRVASACHCGQCRKSSGSFGASGEWPFGALAFSRSASLRWYRSSSFAERGFCANCGSRLFWREDGDPMIWAALGAIDYPTGIRIDRHIFVADKPDWYEIEDGKPRFARYDQPEDNARRNLS
jgi:hypothetical protein